MAEFKLGRIRFIWKGTWAPSTNYVKDDIIRKSGKVYVCLIGHTAASDFYQDLNTTKWELMSDGISWQGTWVSSTSYDVGDIVKVGTEAYICVTAHTSDSTANSGFYTDRTAGYWDLLVSGTDYQGDWNTSTFYNEGDIVTYGARSYYCSTAHTSSGSSTGFYSQIANWTLFNDGQKWRGAWTNGTYYKINDIVNNGGKTYICNLGHTAGATIDPDIAKWDIFVQGLNWRGDWATATAYKLNDIVKYSGNQYICTTAHSSVGTTIDLSKWDLFVEGLEFRDSYNSLISYALGDVVTYGGYVYASTQTNNLNNTPSPTSLYWDVVTTGFNLAGTWSSVTSYKTGDVVSYGAYVYVALLDNNNVSPPSDGTKWQLLVTGFNWTGAWQTATAYKLGDVTTYGPSSYICIAAHTSSTPSRPDNDLLGAYWNALTQGSANQLITTAGDLLYYSGAGAARLPVGTSGQLLRVTSGYPAWYSYGFLNDIYYVAPSGTDDPDIGWSIDNPWKTIRYACERVAAGTKNNNAQWLLSQNNSFMQAEVNNYLLYTYRVSVTGTTANRFTTADTSGLNVGMPIRFSNLVGTTFTVTDTYATQTLTVSSSSGTDLTMSSTITGVNVNQPVVFSNTFGNVLSGTIYYVQYTSGSTLRVSTAPNGSAYTVGSGGTGTATIQGTLVVSSTDDLTVNASFTMTGTPFGNLATATPYYVSNVITSTMMTISASLGGPVLTGITAGSGTLNATSGNDLKLNGVGVSGVTTYYIQSITTNDSFTVAATYNGAAMNATGTGLATGVFYYDQAATLSDTDTINDGVVQDLGRGGNLQTVTNAYKFFSDTEVYVTTAFSYMIPQILASQAYLKTLYNDVMSNTPPAQNYQTLMGVGSPVAQTINLAYTTEVGSIATAQGLVDVIRNAINAGTTAAIPAATKPNATIFVKTGVYPEVLPISVPAFTSIVGDELRAVTVIPYTFTVTATSASGTSLTISDTTGVVAGMGIYGHPNIADGTKISVVGTPLTLDTATTGNVTGPLTVGYSMSDMFYMRDGTVARNLTVRGLYGSLSAPNLYGTKRPTGGSFFSFDPGTGPTDETVWINSRSPYMQNVTLFGTGCTGMKVDGALHNGGNKSMVCNDFTNILSDGIALWCSDLALIEAVSVFSYYGYAGYLTEDGGKIRATNGNSSYGTYGVIAEGTSPYETAITGTVNTRTREAEVGYVMLGNTPTGVGQPLWLEYTNAGQSYTTAPYTITSGTGVSAAVSGINTTSNGINEVRINTAGSGYVTATNVAQSGTATAITISAADTASTGAYIGMRTVIQQGTGSGQYGYINTNNASTKTQIMLKESFTAVSTASCSTTTFTVSSTNTIPPGTPIVFTGTTFGGVANNTVYYVISTNFTGTAFSISTALGGSIFTLSAASGTMNINRAGWDTPLLRGNYTSKILTAQAATVVDSSGNSYALTNSGVTVSSTLIPYGGTYSYIYTASNSLYATDATFAVGTGAFTFEGWVYTTSSAANQGVFGLAAATNNGTGVQLTLLSSGTVWRLVANGTSTDSTATWSTNTWYHFAVVRSGTTTKLYINGTAVVTVSSDSTNYLGTVLDIGTNGSAGFGTNAITGNLSNFRFVNGTAIYTSDFMPTDKPLQTNATYLGVQTVLDGTTRYVVEPRVTFSGGSGSGAFARASVSANAISAIRIIEPGSGYTGAPSITVTDPNATSAATFSIQKGATGVLGQPKFSSRGSGYTDAAVTITGDGFADFRASGFYINLSGLTALPIAGSNVVFTGNPDYYILVQVISSSGVPGNYDAYIQVNPGLTVSNAPAHSTAVTITKDYSQSRLTGHDFLYVGSGNYYDTGFPDNFDQTNFIQSNQTYNNVGGRVFFTSTDQDGNFNVGDLFLVEQSTGVATLSANLFNLSGLNQLQFASGGANITQFSTDGTMTGNSDSLVPTQRAIRAYISSQLGAGGSNISANSLTAGSVYISGTTITTNNSNNLTIAATGTQISVTTKAVFTQAQSSYAPLVDADLANKKYVDKGVALAFFTGAA